MKRMISSAKKPNKFSYQNHRKGIVTFDGMETFEQKYKYNGLSNKMCRLNFIFDTAAHINYAAYLDSSDWSDADVAEMIDSCIDIKDLLASWDAAAVAHLKDVPNDCVGCYINLEVFGVGDSVVRENIFQKLAELRNVDYDVIYNEWLHGGEQISEDELNALKQVFNNIVNKKTESVLIEDEEIVPETEEPIEVNPDEGSEELEAFESEDMTEVQKNAEEAISQVKDPTEEDKLAVNVINGTMDVLIADENSAINGYREFLNQAKETLLPPLYNVLEKEMQEIINDEEDHIAKLETLKAAFHLEDIPLDETKEVKVEAVTLNAVLDELEAGIDSPMAQEDGPKIEEYIKNHPEATLEEVVNAYKNYEETGLFECKEIKTEDHQLYYDDIQEMNAEERHKLWMTEHEEDFEDTDEGNNKFWDWAEEEFPMKELNESNK